MEKPILFSTQMIQAIIDGRKTQTRRIMKPQPVLNNGFWQWHGAGWCDNIKRVTPMPCHSMYNNAPYQPGDILWVRETVWQRLYRYPESEETFYWGSEFKYAATDEEPKVGNWVKRPSIHMPHKAARIFLMVNAIRAEKLQDISETDAIAEGVKHQWGINHNGEKTLEKVCTTVFKELWDSINAKRGYAWDVNPWVWVIEFERVNNI
jgi:hypothetical protein